MQQYIPWFISAVIALFAILTYARNGTKDRDSMRDNEASQMASIKESLLKVNMKLDQVCATTNETRSDIKALNKDMQSMETRVAVLERDLKTAFNKIDDLRGEK